jgi:hypothetical protein
VRIVVKFFADCNEELQSETRETYTNDTVEYHGVAMRTVYRCSSRSDVQQEYDWQE